MNYRFEPAAKEELFAAAEFYENRQAGLGNRFRLAIEEALSRVLRDPESFSSGVAETRTLPLKRFPFQIIYRIENGIVEIYAVAHHSRHPNYWTRRLPDSEG